MWFFQLLRHIWLSGSILLPFMLLVLWSGTKWRRLGRLTTTKKRWLYAWGCFALAKTIALGALSLVRIDPYLEPLYHSAWAADAAWSALHALRILNPPLMIGFVLAFCLDAIVQTSIACVFAALVWWVYGRLTRKETIPSSTLTSHRYGIALLCSACALGTANHIANHIDAMRPVTCFDCFQPHGFPFTYYHEGGFAGGEGIVWSGAVGNALVVILLGAILGWLWNKFPRKHLA